MAGLVLNIFSSQCTKRKLSLENDVDEYHRKHKKIENEDEKLAAHVVHASVDEISRIGKGAYQRRKNRKTPTNLVPDPIQPEKPSDNLQISTRLFLCCY